MKLILITGALLIGLASCSKKQLKKTVTDGTWKITRFIDSGDDKTASYSNATFTFKKNGDLSFVHSSTYSGIWKLEKESDDDHPKNSLEFEIQIFGGHESLSDDWHVESESKSKISLVDFDDEPGKTDYLVLEKM